MRQRRLSFGFWLVAICAGALVASCGGNDHSGAATTAVTTVPVTVVPASPIAYDQYALQVSPAGFSTTHLEVKAGNIQMNIVNTDSVPHDIAFYTDNTFDIRKLIVRTQAIAAGSHSTVKLQLPAHTYYFRDESHPEFTGVIVAS